MDVARAWTRHRGDQVRQLRGRRQRRRAARVDDAPRDATAVAFVAVAPDHVGDLDFVSTRQPFGRRLAGRSEEHTSELQSLMRISYAVFCLEKKITHTNIIT